MSTLLCARLQMAISLGFHIIFASIGIAMPFLMAIAEWKWIKTKDKVYLDLSKAWAQGVAIFFAVGAVSGTVLSFELGLLWPKFMGFAGPIIGMPFALEGTAFFVEAIALGIFLYGWNRVSKWVHWTSGLVVGVSGVFSGLFVVCANGWMNSPTGFEMVDGQAVHIDPWKAMFNPAALWQGVHMTVAAFEATGFAVAGVHAIGLLRGRSRAFHERALRIALVVGSLAALIQPLIGDRLAKNVAVRQPLKLAAMESLFETTSRAPFVMGGIPDLDDEKVYLGLHIPGLLSWLAHGDVNATVAGLKSFPRDEWPPVVVVHVAFQIMIIVGSALALLGLVCLALSVWQPQKLLGKRMLQILCCATPLGFVALEMGWVVTEVGRQPWIIYKIMRTSEAITSMPGLVYPLIGTVLVYAALSFAVYRLFVRRFRHVG